MTDWKPKRFWKDVHVEEDGSHLLVRLDDKPLKTPSKLTLHLPTRDLAEWVADEWRAQDGVVDPDTMPATRFANSAVEKVAPQFDEVARLVASYGETDLVCYRAEQPAALVDRQADGWDPLVEWVADTFGARLRIASGVMPVTQEQAALEVLASEVRGMNAFALAGFHDLVSLSGSLVIGLAVARGALDPLRGWDTSRIDETWQAEQWGFDEEAEEYASRKRAAFLDAERFYRLSIVRR
ncbi:ATPase [Flavimaricola sp.]|nr:ATP12 family protein [Flavimaricola sp.]MDA9020146.1 ATPase [Flavimaricola sp.]